MYEYNCKIVRVIDGDSILIDIDLGFSHWIHGESIRLYGVEETLQWLRNESDIENDRRPN